MNASALLRPYGLLGMFFGSGLAPVAPGTAGSVAAIAFAALVRSPSHWSPVYFAVLAAVFLLPGVWASARCAAQAGELDPPEVVIDEALGQWTTLACATVYNWKSVLGAFFLFRLFDIWKPFPVRHAERLPHGNGIVADDLVAGLFAGLVLWAGGCFNLY
ncbi:MAG: phosphatidylglycerophosphatase A [Bryobacteraceae bacterium]|nr:phosphatidylglycerophosphatase A [Bryobacteraceae bacterium]